MLSYRHGFHAGNFADILKHTVFIHMLEYMTQKEKPLRIIDTHAGAGVYKLNGPQAQKNREFDTGIGRLWTSDTPPAALARLRELVQTLNERGPLQIYPGSPLIAQTLMRPIDRLFLHELHPSDYQFLRDAMRSDKRIKVLDEDGFASLQALLPPLERRALVLIDPSYEIKSDYQHLVKQVIHAHKRFAVGTFAIWYPVVNRARIDEMELALKKSGIKNIQLMEFGIAPDSLEHGMTSSGMIVINPPWTLWGAMEEALPWLVDNLSDEGQGFYRLEQLVAEK
ncbi:23S rRNA (adenine(2030)-N(6))-methyltransferase RlmJ [Cellvibrio sp. PSBB023]|uniref:23S rRNA (adenine(2030)-N(6))-methyltransferase RlmJ n=1 Tax=Cellvibrio sp. PSBB023 TaxID=1945512 RepID=UPI00098F2FF4|nr:23S rRNA (adenine(2030)-N(6))-methyltransferase RlmJ [Cellvibrio sp. PSBB023]AQT61501.1 23S rRNA (adenine(2030)-N(6))-methyltransferase RlmJ [Cellvibrio sp. PSBB023]